MQSTNFLNIAIGIFLYLLGRYVNNIIPRKEVQKNFFLLCISLSLWMFCLGLRHFLPLEFRELALNWTLIPIIFTPYLLYKIVQSVFYKNENPSKLSQGINIGILLYLLSFTVSNNAVKIQNQELFSYIPTIHYHFIIGYITIYIVYSCFLMLIAIFKFQGDLRVRAFLFFTGTLIALVFSILCVYIFPLLGYFYASKSILGFLPFSIIWAIAILHYDAFEIREHIIEEELSLPFLNRISSLPILKLFQILDPEEYCSRIILSKTNVVLKITSINSDLLNRENSKSLNNKDRAEVLARIFFQRIR
ncbi:LIC10906 family membrane protein [Leptospira weilii]|uniref:LIC10906 family membrane protein n=4 Tax=Leptospira weilii TaxID=28184 RepID=UPI0002BED16F|nr:histidine kinase N-terminal 7TM domain-containing protein [Leptospira weilii]EMN43710.1 putative membrane protein [Leptospira weilii str. LNT 1234]ULH29592.1 hypothetical protein FH586_06860 [Leptospira weilii]